MIYFHFILLACYMLLVKGETAISFHDMKNGS